MTIAFSKDSNDWAIYFEIEKYYIIGFSRIKLTRNECHICTVCKKEIRGLVFIKNTEACSVFPENLFSFHPKCIPKILLEE